MSCQPGHLFALWFSFLCNMKTEQKRKPNELIHESSPYLKQHSFNPVNWHPWNKRTLERAISENKLLIISIGYSTCHWCHVMERDSFENAEVAAIMNTDFLPIKVDREERPDIDSVYMQAVQLLTGQGGWPLNCIALPDGRPLYGGTFFPRRKWISVLNQVKDLWKFEPERCKKYAEELIAGIKKSELISKIDSGHEVFNQGVLHKMNSEFEKSFDLVNGGFSRVPKFPMPDHLRFLLNYSFFTGKKKGSEHVLFTLRKIAMGGIYDQLGGGFARYSTDSGWKVPHFEKMLYDNAQLISLYAEAFRLTNDYLFQDVIIQTTDFVFNELRDNSGGFFSGLDADSDEEEGKFYVWTEKEIDSVLNENATLFKSAYSVNQDGYWENGNYILLREKSVEEIAKEFNLQMDECKTRLGMCRNKLLEVRNKRSHPGCDDKFILSWNCLMIEACCQSFIALNDKRFLDMAIETYRFINNYLKHPAGRLYHSTHKDIINRVKTDNRNLAFADDYALYIKANILLFSLTADRLYYHSAMESMSYVNQNFSDPGSGLYFYTSSESDQLIVKRLETEDNVISSSNSILAECLLLLSRLSGKWEWEERSKQMITKLIPYMQNYPSAFANWGIVMMKYLFPHYEVIVTGPSALEDQKRIRTKFLPQAAVYYSSEKIGDIEIFKNKFSGSDKSRIYVCTGNLCFEPVIRWEDALALIKEKH